jgi:bifunctional non-homologous end joining protein LigD
LKLRDLLRSMTLESFPKTSGGKGLHMYVPLNTPGPTFDITKTFSRMLALKLEQENPAGVTASMSKETRRGRVFVDWSQNDRHKTTVCVYSLRAQDEPTVSAPLTWREVESAARTGRAPRFVADNVVRRVEADGDLFAPVLTTKQRLPEIAVQ